MAFNTYAECAHIKRTLPDMELSKEIAEEIGKNYRILPTFEQALFEHKYINHYSLEKNEFLACRWKEYRKYFEHRVFAPFQFVDRRDFHFYNGDTRLIPSESVHKKTDFRNKLRPGPGVDHRGQMPIPNEMIMKRTSTETSRPRPLLRQKGKDLRKNVDNK